MPLRLSEYLHSKYISEALFAYLSLTKLYKCLINYILARTLIDIHHISKFT